MLPSTCRSTKHFRPNGRLRQLFGGHAARVAGASFLAAHGVPTPVIQLLSRWTSRAVERYTRWLWRRVRRPLGNAALGPGGGPRPLALQAARGRGLRRTAAQRVPGGAVEPTLVTHPRTFKVRKAAPNEEDLDRAEWVTPLRSLVLGRQELLSPRRHAPGADACLRCFPPPAEVADAEVPRPGGVVFFVDGG